MSLGTLAAPENLPDHVLFPEAYEASRRMIIRDFAWFGTVIVATCVLAATLGLLAT